MLDDRVVSVGILHMTLVLCGVEGIKDKGAMFCREYWHRNMATDARNFIVDRKSTSRSGWCFRAVSKTKSWMWVLLENALFEFLLIDEGKFWEMI